jgi:O-succinylbenzoic acid--CoA ligase
VSTGEGASSGDLAGLLAASGMRIETDDGVERIGPHAARAARALDRESIGPGEVIALEAERTLGGLATLAGAWSLDLVTLPIAPGHPPVRIEEIVRRSRAHRPGGSPSDRAVAADTPRAILAGAGTVLETSGSSGRPKLVVHAISRHLASAERAAAALGLGADDRWLLSLPIHHVGGLAILFRTLLADAAVVLMSADEPITDAVARTRPTIVSVVARQLDRLLDDAAARRVLAAARIVLAGGGPIPHAMRRRALEAGFPLHVSYGSTETASLVTLSGEAAIVDQPDTGGRPLADCTLATDTDGNLCISGPTLLDGYLEAGALVPALDRRGVLRTSDRGHLDAGGVLHITGRADLAFISGGENVDPLEVEAVLRAHEAIEDAVVVPVPDPSWGHRPVAFVAVRDGHRTSGEAIGRHVAARLPRHAHPIGYHRLGEAGGIKPDRATLAERATTGILDPL